MLMLSYWLNYQASEAPFGFHVTNVLIHLLNGCLVFLIVRKLLKRETPDWLLPAFAAAVFLLHPIQTEAVAYIAGRSETLSVFFFLSAFAVFLFRKEQAVSWKSPPRCYCCSAPRWPPRNTRWFCPRCCC